MRSGPNTFFIQVVALLAVVATASTAEQSSSAGAVNKTGCTVSIESIDQVCEHDTFNATVTLVRDDGGTESMDVDIAVSVGGSEGATVSPERITKCPSTTTLIVIAGTSGDLVIDVGGVTHTVHVLTGTAGEWTRVRTPAPGDPGNLGGAYGPIISTHVVGMGVLQDIRYQGTLSTTFAGAVPVGPWITGECGESIQVTGSASGKFGFGGSYFGFSFGAEVQKSVSFTRTIGGDTGRRYRAMAVAPAVDWFDDRTWDDRLKNLFSTGAWRPYDHRNNVPLGRSYLAGEDVIIEAACCTESE